MITKAQNSSGCESKIYNITPESCFDKRVEDFRIKEIEFNPITKKLIIKQSPDVVISTDILQLNDVSEPTHLSPVEDIVDNIPSNAESGVSYILRVEDKYYHCTWRDTLKYWDRIQLKDGYEFFNKKDSKEYRYNNGALVDISTIHLSMKINQDNIQILNSSGDGVTLPVASPTTPGLFSKEDKTKLDSITKYVKEISFSGADTLVLDIVSSDGTKSLPIREANINQNGLMSKEACLNLSRLLNTVTNNIYTKEEVQELLNKKVDVAPGKDLLDTSQIFKINQIFNYVENVEYSENNNRASLKITTKDPTIGESSSKILSFPDVSSAISGLMSPKYKDYIDSLKSYYTGDPTKEYTGQDLQIIFPIYDPISKKVTSKYLVLDAATSSTAGLITAMEKNKLGNISSIVQAVSDNIYNSNSVILNLVTNNPQTGVEEPVQIVFKSATSEKAGVMSSSDKGKLDNVVKYLTDLIDTDTTSATQAIIHYQSYNPFLNTYEDKYYSLPMATSTIAGSITSTDFNVIQGLKDVNGTPLTYEGTPSKTWKVGDQILKNEKEGFSVRNGDDTEYGDLIVRNLTIKEDIVFGGDAFIIDTEEVKVTDNILTLNSGEQGEGVTKGISGLEIDRGKLPNYFIIFDESDDRFKCGTEGNQFPLMLRDNEPDMVDGAFLTWNSTFKRAQTTSTVPIQLALRFALQNLSEKDTDIIFKRVDNDLYLQYGDTNDKYLSLRVLDDILFKSSPSATKYVFDKEIWASTFKRDDGYEVAFIDSDISDRMFLQYDSDKKTIKALNAVYTDKGGLDFFPSIDDVDNQVKLSTQNGNFDIAGLKASNAWNLVISPRVTLTREAVYKIPILDILTSSHKALGFTNPIILDSYIGFKDQSCQFYGGTDSFTFDIAGDIIRFIPSRDRSLINTNSLELGFSTNIILPTGFRTSDLSQIVFANYWNLNKKYLAWDSNTNVITSIDGFDSLVVINPEDQNKKVVLSYINGGFSISSSSDVPNVPQNTIEISETIGAGNSVTYNLNSTYTPLHINFPMWGEFCDANGKPFATVESLVGHYLPLVAGPTNALTGDLYFQKDYVNIISTQSNGQMSFSSLNELSTWDITFSMNNAHGFGGFEFSTTRDYFYFTKNIYVPSLNIDTDGDFFGTIYGDFYNEKNTLVLNADGDLLHEKGEHTYTIYDSSNLNVEELLQNYTLEGNIIGTPKATRIKAQNLSTLGDSIKNIDFRSVLWGSTTDDNWLIPWRTSEANVGTAGTNAAHIGWTVQNTHAYIGINQNSNNRAVIVGGGSNGTITWFESLAFKSDINGLSTVYYPYSGRGHMTIREDGRPIFTNNQGILFNTTSGFIEGIYVTTNNHLNIGGIQSNNIPVDIYNDLNITRIVDRATKFSLLVFSNGGTEDSQYTHIGAEHGTTRIRSGLFNLVHDRGGTLYTVFDSYNFSRDLGTTSLNSSFNHFPMMAAQPSNSDATTDRGYPIQQAGSLIVIPGVYNGSSQIYGTYYSNRWFVRAGSPAGSNKDEHTAWKELATTTHLSGYLPLTGGTLTGRLTVPRINTNYIESIDGNALLAYHQAGVDGVTNTQVGIGTVVDQMILRSSNTNLMHYKNGTQYTILDTSNIAALTIQFNGSTNTTYAPNAAKTVNITPAAIGAANVGHTHVMSDIIGLSLAWSSITGKPETATRWPSWSEVTSKPINPSYSFGGNNDSITTAQFLTHLQNLGAFSTGFGIYRGSWSYMTNQSITDTGVGVIHLAGSTVEVIGNSASNCTIRVTVPTTSGNGTTKRIYVYCNNGDNYKPGWFAVARTDELTWNSISGKPSTFTPSSHTHTKSQITDFPSSMPASDVYAWAKAPSKPSYSWSEITSKPSTFTPSSHTHPLSDISDLQASWDALLKAAPSAYVTRWPSWSEITSKPINPSYSFGGNNDSITTAQFLTHLQNLGAFSTGFGIYRGSWSYMTNQSITDTGVGVIHLAGSTVEVIGNSASNCTIRVTVPTTSGNGTTKRIYVYCNNGDNYKPGWFAVARTDELTWNSISGKPSTFTPSSHTHTKSQITDFPSSMPASDVYAWAKAPSKPSYSWSEITSKPSTFTPSSHTHPLSDISDLQASWDALLKAAPSAYVTRWPSWSEVTSKPSFATVATSGSYNDLSNRPSIPSAETAATIMSKINSQSEITFTKHVVCLAGAGLQSTSDIRFKSNFNSLPDDTLNKVLNAPEFTYNWKDETTTSIGTSAQYWEDKIPELVHEMEDGTKTFSYERYTVVLQKALKEEHRLREEERKKFKEDINSLNTRLNDLTSLIQKLI